MNKKGIYKVTIKVHMHMHESLCTRIKTVADRSTLFIRKKKRVKDGQQCHTIQSMREHFRSHLSVFLFYFLSNDETEAIYLILIGITLKIFASKSGIYSLSLITLGYVKQTVRIAISQLRHCCKYFGRYSVFYFTIKFAIMKILVL